MATRLNLYQSEPLKIAQNTFKDIHTIICTNKAGLSVKATPG